MDPEPATATPARDPVPVGATERATDRATGDRLGAQLRFVVEAARVTQVVRRNLTVDGGRRETTAEHQWHVGLMALVLAEHAEVPVDAARVSRMLLVHDLVEIDAGDAYLYDAAARAAAEAVERRAARRVFGVLPEPDGSDMLALWEEMEAGETPDARFARAIDRLAPLLCNAASGGRSWRDGGVTAARAAQLVVEPIAAASPALAAAARAVLDAAVAEGLLPP